MIMIDGIEMNTAANYILSQNIPVSNIDRIEVIKSPSSALYGPAGVGGVINIITQKPSKPFESQIKLSFGSFLRQESVMNCKGLMDNNFSYGLSVVMNHTEGFRDESSTNYQIISPRFGYETEKFDFEFISSIKPSKGYQPGGLPLDQYKENPKRATSPNSVGKGYATTWGVKMGFVVNDNSKLNLKSSYRTDNWNAEMDGNYLEGDDQRHLTSEVNYQLSLTKGIIKNTLLAGIEYRIYHSIYHMHPDDYWADKTWWWESNNEIDEDTLGFFAQNEIRFAEKLSVNFGIRFDRIDVSYTDKKNPDNDVETTHKKNSPKIGFSLFPSAWVNIFGNYSHGIRSVNLVETVWSPKKHLNPEKLENFELGIRGNLGDSIRFSIAGFLTQTKDLIIATGTGQTLNWENAGKAESKGTEFSIGKTFQNSLYVNFNYTFQQSEYKLYKNPTDDFSGKDVPLVPKHMIRAGIGFKTNYFGNLDTSIRHIDDKFVDNANTIILDDYTVVDMKYTYQVDMIDIIVSVNNLTDEKYAEYAKMNGGAYVNFVPVAYPADGRSVIGSLLFKF